MTTILYIIASLIIHQDLTVSQSKQEAQITKECNNKDMEINNLKDNKGKRKVSIIYHRMYSLS